MFISRNLCNQHAHLSRRTLLTTGVGGLFFGLLSQRLAAEESNPKADRSRPKSVILVWLQGGASQIDTFDPHAGGIIGGGAKAIETSVKHIQLAETLPQIAEQMHHAAIIRSVTSVEGDHERAIYNMRTGYRPDPTLVHPSLGAVICHQDKHGAEIPRHITILPGDMPSRGGYLGAKFDAFVMRDPATRVPDVTPPVATARYDARISDLLGVVEKRFRHRRLADVESERTLHAAMTARALAMMTSEQLSAFDVTEEPVSVRQPFGNSPFARGCLAAVRLVEVGVRCIEVKLGGWDSHVDNNTMQTAACAKLDPAVASLIKLLNDRDLLKTTLVVVGSEFGRTPQFNAVGGRDHWPHGYSVLLAGCGIRTGVVHGATASDADFNADDPTSNVGNPVTISDVHATILQAVGVDASAEVETPLGRPMAVSEGIPIRGILA